MLSPIGEFARRHDPDRFLCALFAPAPRREALFALIAYHHELGRAYDATTNPLAGAIRLQWWRDALDEPRRHEVATPLHDAITAGLLDRADLLAMADAREAELDEDGFASAAPFAAYLRGAHGGFAVAAGRMLGAAPAELPILEAIGAAHGLALLLRAAPAMAARGRRLLPQDAPAELPEAIRALAGIALPEARRWGTALPAGLPAVLARRDLRHLAAGRAIARGLGDRLAVIFAAMRSRA